MARQNALKKDLMPADEAPAMEEQGYVPVRAEEDECPPRIDGQPTVNGNPIPAEYAHLIPFAKTDQGIWEHNQGKVKARVHIVRTEWDKTLEQRGDMPWASSDPFKSAVDAHRQPGFRYRLLSDKVCTKRGMRGWDPIKNENGDLVKVNGMFVGRMPEKMAHQRNEYYRRNGNDALQKAQEQFELDQEKTIRDAGGQGMSVLRRGERLVDSRDPDREATVGFESVRGQA